VEGNLGWRDAKADMIKIWQTGDPESWNRRGNTLGKETLTGDSWIRRATRHLHMVKFRKIRWGHSLNWLLWTGAMFLAKSIKLHIQNLILV